MRHLERGCLVKRTKLSDMKILSRGPLTRRARITHVFNTNLKGVKRARCSFAYCCFRRGSAVSVRKCRRLAQNIAGTQQHGGRDAAGRSNRTDRRGRRTKHDSPRDIPRGCLREDIVVSRNRASGGGEDHAALDQLVEVSPTSDCLTGEPNPALDLRRQPYYRGPATSGALPRGPLVRRVQQVSRCHTAGTPQHFRSFPTVPVTQR